MCRIVLAILIGLFCCGPAVNSVGQTRKIDSAEVLKQLLAMPAPTPRNAANPTPQVNLVEPRPQTFYYKNNTPPDDAPIEDLVEYWARWAESDRDPSDAVKQRLLAECIANPEILTVFLNLLPDADSTPAKVKNIYDKALADQKFDPSWLERVRRWLVYNSTYFLDELMAMAHKAKDDEKDGNVKKEEALAALATVSWTNAEPILRGLLASGQPRSSALALSLYYEHAIEEKDTVNEERYRRDLRAIASNRNQPGYARNVAIESLSLTEWSGRDDWYIDLFQDETLLNADDGEYSSSPLTTLFQSDPEKWIPVMARLTESKDINVRSAAAACLVRIADEENAKKALPPVLPWLANRAWANDASNVRLRLIESLASITIPESVPGLIAILESEEAEENHARGFAAMALANYPDPRAVAALKRAFAKEKEEIQRQRIIKGLLGTNGLPEKDQLEALEAYAARLTTPEGRIDMIRYRGPQDEPLPPTLSIGKYLGQSRETPSESLINQVRARAEELRTQNSPVAEALTEITHQWQGQQIELDIIRRIGNGSADSATVIEAIQRKDKMQQGLRAELQGLAAVAGAAQGIGAVLLNDPLLAQGILTSADEPAQIGLLACSRLTQTPLPVELIGPFLRHKNPLLAQAAETYLLAEDSPQARDILWQRHPNEAFITGWRDNIYGGNQEAIGKSEEKLHAELFTEKGPTEIFALVSNLPEVGLMILRVYPDKAVYTEYDDAARYRERALSPGEVSAFKDFLSAGGFIDRGPSIQWCHHGCPTSELLTLTKEKGRRVFNQGGFDDWTKLQEQFSQLAGENANVHYKLEQEIKGLEVLYAGELAVNSVAQQGSEFRILVERPETKEEAEERIASYNVDDEDDETLRTQLARRRIEILKARYSWRVLTNGKPGAVTSQPDFYSMFDESRFITGDEDEVDWDARYGFQIQVISPDSIIIARNDEGLWRQFAGTKAVRVGTETGSYSHPVVTRDGKWVIVLKNDNEEDDKTSYIVRLNLQTGRELRVNPVNLATKEELAPLVYLPSLGKVLVGPAAEVYERPSERTPTKADGPQYFLLDPSTGVTRAVSGDFTPLNAVNDRFLQTTEKPEEFWAAIPDEKKIQTQIGRYNVKDFSFKPVMVVPQLVFDSMSMWVDAGPQKVYVVYKGQLLRLPLQATDVPAVVTKK